MRYFKNMFKENKILPADFMNYLKTHLQYGKIKKP